MAGKAIGEFSLKAITATYSPGPAGGVLNQVNWEGTATGFGTVFGTATSIDGAKGGSSGWCGRRSWTTAACPRGWMGTVSMYGQAPLGTKGYMDLADGRRIAAG